MLHHLKQTVAKVSLFHNLLAKSINAGTVKISHTNGFSLEINSDTDLNQIKPVLELLRTVS